VRRAARPGDRGVADRLQRAHGVHHHGDIAVVERGHERGGGERRLLAAERTRGVRTHERVRVAQERRHHRHDARRDHQLLERVDHAPAHGRVFFIAARDEGTGRGGVREPPQRLAHALLARGRAGAEQRQELRGRRLVAQLAQGFGSVVLDPGVGIVERLLERRARRLVPDLPQRERRLGANARHLVREQRQQRRDAQRVLEPPHREHGARAHRRIRVAQRRGELPAGPVAAVLGGGDVAEYRRVRRRRRSGERSGPCRGAEEQR
jgi:hypothetical protein